MSAKKLGKRESFLASVNKQRNLHVEDKPEWYHGKIKQKKKNREKEALATVVY